MKDINDVMPKVPNMKWGALLNKKPTNKKIEELNNLLPHNGRWHTVYEEDDVSIIDGVPIIKKEKDSMTCLLYTSPSPRDATRSRMPS